MVQTEGVRTQGSTSIKLSLFKLGILGTEALASAETYKAKPYSLSQQHCHRERA